MTSAYGQDAPPKAGNKPLVQVTPKEPMGCKFVGRVPELKGAIPSRETPSVPEPPTGAIPPDQK